jgi:hypothetical protein
MAKGKKTISVQAILDYANNELAYGNSEVAYRQGVINLLEEVLRKTNNYHGFRYLSQEETYSNVLPGIREFNKESGSWNFENTDRTRVKYS